ncbi:MAG: DUF3160 domain-containing protein [Limisphaerales bacterium]
MTPGRFFRGFLYLVATLGLVIRGVFLFLITAVPAVELRAEPLSLAFSGPSSNVVISWPAQLHKADQTLVFPQYQLQCTSNLLDWQTVSGAIQANASIVAQSGPMLTTRLQFTQPNAFYRMVANLDLPAPDMTGKGGAEVFGYAAAAAAQLANLGQISPAQFAAIYDHHPPYLPQITWDPTTALYWPEFNTDPAAWNATNTSNFRSNDFRLNPAELAIFMTNGFVVSERLSSLSFGEGYYRVFNDDLPVFVTSDSVLQAWHRTYVSMLEESEELQIATLLERVINGMSDKVTNAFQTYGQQAPWLPPASDLANSVSDADYFLAVARSLWTGQTQPSKTLWDDSSITATLTAISNLVPAQITIFGSNRVIDFSQFTVRGHYDNSERLRRYFRTMMWCGLVDLRIKTYAPNNEDDIRQLGTAVIFKSLLDQSGQYNNWAAIEQFTRAFVGQTDSMTFAQFNDLLASAGITSPSQVSTFAALTNLQQQLVSGQLGMQNVRSDYFFSPLNAAQIRLPRSFCVFGQKFVPDSWAFSEVTYDSIRWWPDDGTNVIFGKVVRRKPSCLDVAFSVFGNDQVVPNLVDRMNATNGVRWRDGLPYQHNLAAVRNVIDSQVPGTWTNNMYSAWLAAIRALSFPTTDPIYPEAMRTHAWGMKTVNAQLASWTQLRHDTVLYAKQSYTGLSACSYPYGFVEPNFLFWSKMKTLVDVSYAGILNLPSSGTVTVASRDGSFQNVTYDLAVIKSNQLAHLQNFANTMLPLQGISEKELLQVPLVSSENDFLKNLIELHIWYTGERSYTGWYPSLFYKNVYQTNPYQLTLGAGKWDALVTDVHTDPADPFLTHDPGAVIEEAVGNVHTMLIAVDNGIDRMIYAGPVLSHYEFEVPPPTRKTDADWKATLKTSTKPPSPDWTSSYLVPYPFVVPASAN